MCNQNVLPLSLNGDTFNAMKADFDIILRNTLSNMELKGADAAEMNVKLKISLAKEQTRDFDATYDGAMRDIIKPKFEHAVQSILQIKDKKDGTLSGNYELVWDKELQKYVMREIADGQTSLFDRNNGSQTTIHDVDYVVVEESKPALEGRKVAQLPAPADTDAIARTPFDWILQFVGVPMKALESMGICTVRTDDNKVVLTSAGDASSPFYCPVETLEPHVGHALTCIGSPTDEPYPDEISIWCNDCDEMLFSINDKPATEFPQESEEDGDNAQEAEPCDTAEGVSDGDTEENGYGYEPPEVRKGA